MDVLTAPDNYIMVDNIDESVDDTKLMALARSLFSNMTPVVELPDTTDQKICYQKLLPRLASLNLEIHQVVGVGDCYFRSLADQIVSNDEYHPFFRAVTAAYMRANRASFEVQFRKEFPLRSYDAYCDEVATLKKPVGEIPILASCEAFGIKIIRIFSYGTRVVEVLVPRSKSFTKVVYISFIHEHADSVFPIGTRPPPRPAPLSKQRRAELKKSGSYTVLDHSRNMRYPV